MNRRDFLNGLMAGAAALGTSGFAHPARADAPSRRLAIVNRTLEINGKAARVFGLAQPDGMTGLTLQAGSAFDVTLTNDIAAPTLVHWHGLTPPWKMDGVPDNPAPPLKPGEPRRYTFPAGAGGTHWMHAHTLQEQNLLAAPLIVRTIGDVKQDEQEIVILLHDFSFTPAKELLARLTAGKGGGNMSGMDVQQMMKVSPNMDMSHMDMPGMAMDLNDIDFDAYLANDRTLADPDVVQVEKGGRVRLRLINGATATSFMISTGGLPAELIAVDGQDVAPIAGTAFPISMGQRLDLRLHLPARGAWPILALREGARERAGIVLATPGAAVRKLAVEGDRETPALNLGLERRLRARAPLTARTADQRFSLSLTGDMAGYRWGLSDSTALRVKRGQRVEIALKNNSMMAHPMHLHGHHFQVVAIDGKRFAGAVRDTVFVPSMADVTIAFDADNPGHWPLHCHNLYHMAAGMMTYVSYEGVG
ncbi:copper oxidase [Methylovirgula ligni]|uniref:FtsP/CotA-like multicopper oxidase with cupredoxin domain n=1 Tax=Methylovirgula ligni TaxID=569860 RepID=A0A3D9Z1Q8_9HYPH|nr:multicopper oxidase family protein [Methylovirgula ligni]QAY97258.1 copper oxidase [Methylovirgula ligni]REF89001.1 FtsP/CotA-like multicopper oxidase with cupredoxin domain [Methylovirgula ligni]